MNNTDTQEKSGRDPERRDPYMHIFWGVKTEYDLHNSRNIPILCTFSPLTNPCGIKFECICILMFFGELRTPQGVVRRKMWIFREFLRLYSVS